MSRNGKTTAFLKECMADALLKLMKTTPIEKITVCMITETAGVGRTTWFRNFKTKQEALVFKRMCLWDRWADEHGLEERGYFDVGNAQTFFDFQFAIRDNTALLYKSGQQAVINESFSRIIRLRDMSPYEQRYYAFALFGLIDEWCGRGFSETPEEMVGILLRIMSVQLK